MDKLLQKFNLPFSTAPKEVIILLKAFAKKQPRSEASPLSKALLKKVETYQKNLTEHGLPPFLQIAEVNHYIETGVFLKPTAKALKPGTFIGIYTGEYELVLSTETKNNHYAYDVATGLKIKQKHLPLIRSQGKNITVKEEYSIQTNAAAKGNFTRYINHSSVKNNIEAFTRTLPDGTIEVCLFTSKKICPGEQLLSNYGGQYWAVLPIIPEPVTPRSYKLGKDGHVVKNPKIALGHPFEEESLLKSMRSGLEIETGELERSFRSYLCKKKIRYVTKSLEKKIDLFEDDILERGLPLNFELKECTSPFKWEVYLGRNGKKIKKGGFIGVIGGKWCLVNHLASNMVDSGLEYKGKHLYLNQKECANFTRLIPSTTKGNIKATLYKKKGPNGLYIVLTALKDIKPGEKLLIQKK
jgi:hypothetical protein